MNDTTRKKEAPEDLKFYSLNNIKKHNAVYNLIIGERSNGKTYAVLSEILNDYITHHHQSAYIRRWELDIKANRGKTVFKPLVKEGYVFKKTKGEWTDIIFQNSSWYLCRYDEKTDTIVKDVNPFCYAYALTGTEHDKGSSNPDINTIFFDECITRDNYLTDEFVLFMNTISTIVRYRDTVKIYMCGNTISKYCPYFTEMGLRHIKDMKPGDIEVYNYGDSRLKVAVEFSDMPNKKGKPSDFYFAFDNPRLKMITGGGAWEMDIYPHCPIRYENKHIVFNYFIKFEDDILQCEIVQIDDSIFTFIHRKTTELKDVNNDLIFSPEFSIRPNWRRRLTQPHNEMEKKICSFFVSDKVYYQSNEIGEIVRAYLQWCKKL